MEKKRQKENQLKSSSKLFKNKKGTDDGFKPVYEFKRKKEINENRND